MLETPTRRLIERDKSVIVAADVRPNELEDLVKATRNVDGISGYKIGFNLGLRMGLSRVVDVIRNYSDLLIIYDHQKAGTDIPDTGREFAEAVKDAGVDATILFPFAGPKTQIEWTEACQKANLDVIIGGHMTHDEFLSPSGGYIYPGAPEKIYRTALEMGIMNFVLPGNRPQLVRFYREVIERYQEPGTYDVFSPGFIDQKGVISEYALVAGPRWHAIVGRGIYATADIHNAALMVTSQIR